MSMDARKWWKEGVVYQVYPRSFKDSNGDGIGDLNGVLEKLDYLKELGIDIIWLCPIFKSPNDDNGYDVSDYRDIMDEFGTMDDFDRLLAATHDRGMKMILDLVANHSSDEHQWFQESRKSKDNPYRDYYYWRKGDNGQPPSNWPSFFGGSTWEYDPATDEYYLHLFSKKQPDLNWENPKLRQEVHDIVRFWFEKGVDGFRMDVITAISKDLSFQDVPKDRFYEIIDNHYTNGPRIHEFLRELNSEVLSKYDIMTVGEGPGINLGNCLDYVGQDRNELDMIFHFDHMYIDHGPGGKYDPKPYDLVEFKKIFTQWDERLRKGGWGSIFLGNHDFSRIVSRFGNDKEYHAESAKLLATLLMTMRGTPYIYQGEEIGMTNVAFDSIEHYNDIEAKNAYHEAIKNGLDLDKFMKGVHEQGRDNSRTPFHWSHDSYAGFSSAKPWIGVNPNFKEINVDQQNNQSDSILNFYRSMVSFRKAHLTMVYGSYECLFPEHDQLYVYTRADADHQYLVLLNFSETILEYPGELSPSAQLVVNNYISPNESKVLRPWEAKVFECFDK